MHRNRVVGEILAALARKVRVAVRVDEELEYGLVAARHVEERRDLEGVDRRALSEDDGVGEELGRVELLIGGANELLVEAGTRAANRLVVLAGEAAGLRDGRGVVVARAVDLHRERLDHVLRKAGDGVLGAGPVGMVVLVDRARRDLGGASGARRVGLDVRGHLGADDDVRRGERARDIKRVRDGADIGRAERDGRARRAEDHGLPRGLRVDLALVLAKERALVRELDGDLRDVRDERELGRGRRGDRTVDVAVRAANEVRKRLDRLAGADRGRDVVRRTRRVRELNRARAGRVARDELVDLAGRDADLDRVERERDKRKAVRARRRVKARRLVAEEEREGELDVADARRHRRDDLRLRRVHRHVVRLRAAEGRLHRVPELEDLRRERLDRRVADRKLNALAEHKGRVAAPARRLRERHRLVRVRVKDALAGARRVRHVVVRKRRRKDLEDARATRRRVRRRKRRRARVDVAHETRERNLEPHLRADVANAGELDAAPLLSRKREVLGLKRFTHRLRNLAETAAVEGHAITRIRRRVERLLRRALDRKERRGTGGLRHARVRVGAVVGGRVRRSKRHNSRCSSLH